MNAIQGASPWTRHAIKQLTQDEFAEIEATVPDGMYAVLLCGRRPGDWSVSLLRAIENGQRPQAVEVARVKCYDIVNGVRAAVRAATDANCDHTDAYGSTVMEGGPLSPYPGVLMCFVCDARAPFLRVVEAPA